MTFDLQQNLLPGLPPYAGGRMSDTCYDAGQGLHAAFKDGKPFEFPAHLRRIVNMLNLLPYLEGAGYRLSEPIPESEFGPITCSNGKTTYTAAFRDGMLTILQTQTAFPLDAACLLRAVTGTDKSAFDAYLALLANAGWSIAWQNRMEDNHFRSLSKDGHRIYAAFYGREGIARFVQDDLGTPIEAFGYGADCPGGTLQVCQFGLYYNRMILRRSSDCGMLYIVKLPDDSLFLVDGGLKEQATEAAAAEAMRMLRKMSGAPEGEPIRIAGWFCTHGHDDHSDLFCKLLRFHHDELDVQRVIFNFPAADGVWGVLPLSAHLLLERLHQYCPNAKYLKCHTGQSWELAGVRFDVLQTHEDGVGPTGQETILHPAGRIDFNDTSTVLKLSYAGASFMLLGDINNGSAVQMQRHFGPETLSATMMQAAHHLINNLPELYPTICPEIALVPCSVTNANPQNTHYATLLQTVAPQNIYFASCATDVFQAENGHFQLIERFPVEGYLYDGSDM